MIILDENFPESQRQLLKSWRISVRQIGREAGRAGMKDDEIIPYLLQLRRSTFFTLDLGFYKRIHRHQRCCLVCLDVGDYDAASFVRRCLNHQMFDTEAHRLGNVLRLSYVGISVWKLHATSEQLISW